MARKSLPKQQYTYYVQFRVPGSPWVWFARTGSGSTTNPDNAFKFSLRDDADDVVRRLSGPRSSIEARVIQRLLVIA